MDARALVHEMQLDLGLRSEFEAELRKTLTAFRQAPKAGKVEVHVSIDLAELSGWKI